jgi:hypothetical protein
VTNAYSAASAASVEPMKEQGLGYGMETRCEPTTLRTVATRQQEKARGELRW